MKPIPVTYMNGHSGDPSLSGQMLVTCPVCSETGIRDHHLGIIHRAIVEERHPSHIYCVLSRCHPGYEVSSV